MLLDPPLSQLHNCHTFSDPSPQARRTLWTDPRQLCNTHDLPVALSFTIIGLNNKNGNKTI